MRGVEILEVFAEASRGGREFFESVQPYLSKKAPESDEALLAEIKEARVQEVRQKIALTERGRAQWVVPLSVNERRPHYPRRSAWQLDRAFMAFVSGETGVHWIGQRIHVDGGHALRIARRLAARGAVELEKAWDGRASGRWVVRCSR